MNTDNNEAKNSATSSPSAASSQAACAVAQAIGRSPDELGTSRLASGLSVATTAARTNACCGGDCTHDETNAYRVVETSGMDRIVGPGINPLAAHHISNVNTLAAVLNLAYVCGMRAGIAEARKIVNGAQ